MQPSATSGWASIGQLASAPQLTALTLLSNATYAVLADEMLPDLRFRDLGEHALKDIDRPERLYQLVAPDLPSDFPPLRGTGASSHEEEATAAGERVVVADDSVLLREGLVRLLRDAGFAVVGTAADADELLQKVAELRPSIAITDIRMPPTQTDEGLVAAREIRRLYPEMGVLVLSHYIEPKYATRLLEEYPERTGYLLRTEYRTSRCSRMPSAVSTAVSASSTQPSSPS